MSDLRQTSTPAYSDAKAEQNARWKAARERMAGAGTTAAPVKAIEPRKTLKQLLAEGGYEIDPVAKSGLEIIDEVSIETGIPVADILSHRRAAAIIPARHLAMWRVHKRLPHYTLPMIGRLFRRDHTTVLYAVRKIDRQVSQGAGT